MRFRDAFEGDSLIFPWVLMRKDGTPIDTEISLRNAVFSGERNLIMILRDVTGLNPEEQQVHRLASFPALNPDPVIEVGSDGGITYSNPACMKVLQKMGMPLDPAAFLPADIATILRTNHDTLQSDLYREVPVGDASFAETITYSEEFKTIRIYAHDITERIQITSALEQANRKLNLLSSITRHDIKNKLTGVLGYLEPLAWVDKRSRNGEIYFAGQKPPQTRSGIRSNSPRSTRIWGSERPSGRAFQYM